VILLVGLGNPGPRYRATRHNLGFMVVERAVERASGGPWRAQFAGRTAALRLGAERALALLPETFMNDSGRSVQACVAYYDVPAEQVLVAHDELDLPFGELRLKKGGGEAGHRGLVSVSRALGTSDYVRLRVGIGRPPPDFQGDTADFVLQAFPPSDRASLDQVLDRAVAAVTLFAERGLSAAMNVVNQRSLLPPRAGAEAQEEKS
jgi:PTH1 family peptidyl-tRNA hydrolase